MLKIHLHDEQMINENIDICLESSTMNIFRINHFFLCQRQNIAFVYSDDILHTFPQCSNKVMAFHHGC